MVQIAHTKNQKRKFYCPVTIAEGVKNVQHTILDADTEFYKEINDTLTQLYEKDGDRNKKHQEVVQKALELIELQIL